MVELQPQRFLEHPYDTLGMEYDGVRRDMTGISHRAELEALAQLWIDAGMRPPQLAVYRDGVDVSKEPHLWPALERDYRGPGRLEWVGDQG